MTNRYERPKNIGDALKGLVGIVIFLAFVAYSSRSYQKKQEASQIPDGFKIMTIQKIFPAFAGEVSNPDYLVQVKLQNGEEEVYTLASRTFVNVSEVQKNITLGQIRNALEMNLVIKCSDVIYSDVDYLVTCKNP